MPGINIQLGKLDIFNVQVRGIVTDLLWKDSKGTALRPVWTTS